MLTAKPLHLRIIFKLMSFGNINSQRTHLSFIITTSILRES